MIFTGSSCANKEMIKCLHGLWYVICYAIYKSKRPTERSCQPNAVDLERSLAKSTSDKCLWCCLIIHSPKLSFILSSCKVFCCLRGHIRTVIGTLNGCRTTFILISYRMRYSSNYSKAGAQLSSWSLYSAEPRAEQRWRSQWWLYTGEEDEWWIFCSREFPVAQKRPTWLLSIVVKYII